MLEQQRNLEKSVGRNAACAVSPKAVLRYVDVWLLVDIRLLPGWLKQQFFMNKVKQ